MKLVKSPFLLLLLIIILVSCEHPTIPEGLETGDDNLFVNVARVDDDAEEKMTVTIEALDADNNVLATKVVENVPFKRNRQTILRGKVFTAGTSGVAFTLETAWLEDKTVDF